MSACTPAPGGHLPLWGQLRQQLLGLGLRLLCGGVLHIEQAHQGIGCDDACKSEDYDNDCDGDAHMVRC